MTPATDPAPAPGPTAFSDARGGSSAPPYAAGNDADGLNLGLHVGDEPRSVHANRAALAAAVRAPVAFMDQVHGAQVRVVTRPPTAGSDSQGTADVLVAAPDGTEPVAVAVMVADCVPLLLTSADGALAAAVHVGRGGLMAGVVDAALDELTARGASTDALSAELGPSICGRCYEVPPEMQSAVAATYPRAAARTRQGTAGLDIAAAVVHHLRVAGVASVTQDERCTYEDGDLYSYRRATHAGDGRTGRQAGVAIARRVGPVAPPTLG